VNARTAIELEIDGYTVIAGRTGYTGEDGFELYLPSDRAVPFWEKLLAAGAPEGLLPCGLAARDSLRFEACMPLYGHELSPAINALEARMGWTVSWHKEFVGRSALLKVKLEGPSRLLVGFEMLDKAVAREHYDVAADGQVVGHVTSGMKSPTLDKFLGMALVPASHAAVGAEFDILVRGQPKRARVVKRPFYKPRYKSDR
jgi:aminomethyltransferase